MSVNNIVFGGRLGADVQETAVGESTVYKFSVASTRKFTSKGEQREKTTWARVNAWNKTASGIAPYLTKGKEVVVEGSLETDEYEKDGQKRTFTYINANRIHLVGPKIDTTKATFGDDFGDIDDFGADDFDKKPW